MLSICIQPNALPFKVYSIWYHVWTQALRTCVPLNVKINVVVFSSLLLLLFHLILTLGLKQQWTNSTTNSEAVTLMLFLNWYPGVDEPLRKSSLKMTICSNRKTLRSLLRDRTPESCSVTKNVSCCRSFPWLVNFPWSTQTYKLISLRSLVFQWTHLFWYIQADINRCHKLWRTFNLF